MRKILALAWNNIRLELSDRSSLVFLLILPLAFTYIIGIAMGGAYEPESNASTDTRHPVIVVDQDASALSAQLIAVIETSQIIRPVEQNLSDAIDIFKGQGVSAYVVIPAGFGASITTGQPTLLDLVTAAGDNYALTTGQAVQAAVAELNAILSAAKTTTDILVSLNASSLPYDQLLQENLQAASAVAAEAPVTVLHTGPSATTSEIAVGFAQTSPGQLVTWVLITLLGSSVVIASERTKGTLYRLMAAPLSKGQILAGIILGRLALGLVQIIILIGFGSLVLGVDWGSSYSALALLSLSFALAAVALGLLIGVLSKTAAQARELTTAISMITAALGGAWWPMEITPQLYQTAVKILPTTWAMQGFTDVILRGQDVSGILIETLVLLGFAVAFFAFSAKKFDYE